MAHGPRDRKRRPRRGRAALAAEARHEEQGVGHRGAQFGQLGGIRGADNRPYLAVAARRRPSRPPALDVLGHVAIERPAVGHEILEHLPPGFDVFDQHEDAGRTLAGHVDERPQAVVAQVGADGQGVGPPRTLAAGAEHSVGIGRGRRADVVPLAVEDHQQALLLGVGDHFGQDGHAGRPKLLEERRLRLDRRHQRGHHVDHAAAEPPVGGGRFRPRGLCDAECPRADFPPGGQGPRARGLRQRRTAVCNRSANGGTGCFLPKRLRPMVNIFFFMELTNGYRPHRAIVAISRRFDEPPHRLLAFTHIYGMTFGLVDSWQ